MDIIKELVEEAEKSGKVDGLLILDNQNRYKVTVEKIPVQEVGKLPFSLVYSGQFPNCS